MYVSENGMKNVATRVQIKIFSHYRLLLGFIMVIFFFVHIFFIAGKISLIEVKCGTRTY